MAANSLKGRKGRRRSQEWIYGLNGRANARLKGCSNEVRFWPIDDKWSRIVDKYRWNGASGTDGRSRQEVGRRVSSGVRVGWQRTA